MDVSYTDHSHVIGRGGNNIKHVMQQTACHIHFPDSNRSNQSEKSNQVRAYSYLMYLYQWRCTFPTEFRWVNIYSI